MKLLTKLAGTKREIAIHVARQRDIAGVFSMAMSLACVGSTNHQLRLVAKVRRR